MKKELLTAIAIGAIFGFIITGSFWAIREGKIKSIMQGGSETKENSDLSKNNQDQNSDQENEKPDQPLVHLEIDSPPDESIVTKSELKITGQTESLSTLVILHQKGDEIISADQNGGFELNIELDGGLNIIKIISFDQNGNFTEKTLYITYSTAKI